MNLRLALCFALTLFASDATPALGDTLEHYVPPRIGGHVTDPVGRLNGEEKSELEILLGSIQSDTKVDVAAFIAPVAPRDLEAAGREAYRQWGIGRDWQTGALLLISDDGEACRLVVPDQGSPLPPTAVSDIEVAVSQPAREANFAQALRVAGEKIGALLRARAKIPIARPYGPRDPLRSMKYGSGALLVTALAGILSIRRRLAWQPR